MTGGECSNEGGVLGRACAPSGKSVGAYEALEIKDGGSRYNGMSVLTAVRNVNEALSPELKGMDATSQKEIDKSIIRIDGTEN